MATLQDAASRAASEVLAGAGGHWLLACDVDADGLCAAAVTAQALRRRRIRFTVRASRDKTAAGIQALFAEAWDGLILLDKGSGQLPLLAALCAPGRRVVVVDHHNVALPPPDGVALLNPRAHGLDGSRDASAATAAVALALALCGDAALAWAPTGLAGAAGDRQDEGGWRGWNLELAERARAAGHLGSAPLPRLADEDLAAGLARLGPPVPGLAGDVAAAAALLEGLGVGRDAAVEDMDVEARTRLVSALLLRHLAAGQAPDPQALVAPWDLHVALGMPLRQVTRAADACGRAGASSTGIAFLLGDAAARGEALARLAQTQQEMAEAARALRATGLAARRALRMAWTARAEHSGLVANRAMLGADDARPVLVLARRPDGAVQASARGTHAQVAAGLDLGRAMAQAAVQVEGEGGGHPVAAGAVVPHAAAAAFVDALDAALVAQGFLEAAR